MLFSFIFLFNISTVLQLEEDARVPEAMWKEYTVAGMEV